MKQTFIIILVWLTAEFKSLKSLSGLTAGVLKEYQLTFDMCMREQRHTK